jgi:hypothetical protein
LNATSPIRPSVEAQLSERIEAHKHRCQMAMERIDQALAELDPPVVMKEREL